MPLGWAFSVSAHEDDLETVGLHLKWKHQFQFAGYYAAIEKGYYADEGLSVELIEGGPDKNPVRELLEGHAQYAVGNASALLDRAEGNPVVVLASVFQHTAQVIYTRPDINSPEELRGKRIVMLQDGRRELEAFALLKKFDINKADFVLRPDGTPEDLVSGKVDAWPGYSSNEAYQFKQNRVGYRMFRPQDYGLDIYGDTLLTTEMELQENPQRADAFHRATIKGWEYALNHVDEMIELIKTKYDSQQKSRDYLKFEADVIGDLMIPNVIPIGLSNLKRWQRIATEFEALGYPVGQVEWKMFIYQPKPTLAHLLDHHVYPYRYWIGMALLITLVLTLYAFNRQLLRGISSRTAELEALSVEYRDILDQMQDTYYRVDTEGKLLWVSASVKNHLGYDRESLVGNYSTGLYFEKDGRKKHLQAIAESGGKVEHYELCLRHKDGTPFWTESNSQYVFDENRKVIGVEGNLRDINARKQAQLENEELTSQLQQAQKMESIGVLAGGIAHDFNNLLAAVMGNAELALLDAPEHGEMRHFLAQIFKASRKGADLVRQLLAYSGQGRFAMGEQNLNTLIAEVSDLLGTVIGKKIQLEMELEDGLANINGDKNQLTQMLMNLMTNAAESMSGSPGTISLHTGSVNLTQSDFARMYLNDDLQDGAFVFIEVRDSGCGMDRHTQKRIFDPFFTTKETGSGLGLAALLGIVRSHGGALTLDSEPGRGSCFTIYLPALESTVYKPAETALIQPESLKGLSGVVLLVDDEAQVRDVATRILEREGMSVISAADGKEGLALFRKHADEISLVLLDLTMPIMDGEQAFRLMHAYRPEIPVLLSSGFSESQAATDLSQQGLAGFVRKPYTRNTLLQAVIESGEISKAS
ncbi:PAS domain S-box-containing protein [Mariprofundus aestuarium]|uniref:histidine kinase n=2 Tax=Mariprofundus aestuarium TaxID=1921086 RepID=A0A2K8KW59_MARES|nr:PAS domain S-box-containing protein [Mariprofundus aestuarium]